MVMDKPEELPSEEESFAKEEKPPVTVTYADLKTADAEREVHVELSKGDGQKSYGDAVDTPNLTDLQATLRRLFPSFFIRSIDRSAQPIMVSRIAPDVFLEMICNTVSAVVEEMECLGEAINVQEILALSYSAFSIGLDGKGRIDALELAGSAKEAEELERVSRQLFAS